MYHVTLHIHVFGAVNGPSLMAQLQETAPLERFEHRFSHFPQPGQAAVSGGDVLILADGADREALTAIRSWRKERSTVVLCAGGERLSQLDEAELALVDRVWPMPLTPALLQFEFTGLLRALKARKDAWLTQAYLDTGINSIPMLVWYKDARGAHLKVNESFCGAVGKTMEQIENRGHYYIWDIPEEEYRQGEYICLESEVETMEKRRTCLFDENVKTKHGMRKFKTYKTPIFDEDGVTVLGTVGVANDVTDYLNMGSELDALIDNIPLGVLICGTDGEILNVNRTMCDFFPDLTQRNAGLKYQDWKSGALRDVRNGVQPHLHDTSVQSGEQPIILEFQETPLNDVFHNTVGSLCLFRNVTLSRTYEAKIAHYANTDALTGLSTRRSFFKQIEQKGDPTAVFFIDLDNFKGVNDRFGHHVGDLALQAVASAMQETFPDAVNARTGGDEFVAVLHGPVSREALGAAAETLQARVRSATPEAMTLPLSVSVGIAHAESPIAVNELMHLGDVAMYAVKRQGKGGHTFYDPSMETQ